MIQVFADSIDFEPEFQNLRKPNQFRPMTKPTSELDTALSESGLFPQNVWDGAGARVVQLYFDHNKITSTPEWLADIRSDFRRAMTEQRFNAAAALAYEALTYAHSPDTQFQVLVMQGTALTELLKEDGRDDLHDFRCAAFENAMLALPDDRGWGHEDMICRVHLARAWQARGTLKDNLDDLEAAHDEYAALLPELERGRWGFPTHAKAAEIAVYLAQTETERARLGEALDPLPHWLRALALGFDPRLRAADALGSWDPAADALEAWLDQINHNSADREACSAAANVLQRLEVPPENDDYGWVQFYIGVLTRAAGLHGAGLRVEVQDPSDEAKLVAAVDAHRRALADVEAGDGDSSYGAAFHLAYTLHALGEARADAEPLVEAISLYDRVARILGQEDGIEERLQLGQVQTNLSEAMAELAKIEGDADLARNALRVAGDAEMTFTLWAHGEGIELAQANCAKIMAVVEEIEIR